jgi:pimeloyl-ACP methyl ester carboxylesterase
LQLGLPKTKKEQDDFCSLLVLAALLFIRRSLSSDRATIGDCAISNHLPDIGKVTWLRIADLEVRVANYGKSVGVPILLTSPWPESIFAFRDILPSIATLGPLVAVDLPGFGRSQSRPDLMAPEAMGDFIIKLAAELRIERMHAVGPDVGTLALLFAAARKPGLFESLVVGGGATSIELASGALKNIIEGPMDAFDNAEGGDIAVQAVLQHASAPPPVAVLDDYRQSSAGQRFAQASKFVRAYARELPKLHGLLPGIATPTLILAAKDDLIVPPANGAFLAEKLPNCKFVLLEGGHLVWEDNPTAYAREISAWISSGYRST